MLEQDKNLRLIGQAYFFAKFGQNPSRPRPMCPNKAKSTVIVASRLLFLYNAQCTFNIQHVSFNKIQD